MDAPLRLSRQTRAVLAALLELPAAWSHGYDLMQRTALKSGTLYPLLMRLADRGLVEAEWQPPVPPARAPRHAYRLTKEGLNLARASADRAPTRGTALGGVLPA